MIDWDELNFTKKIEFILTILHQVVVVTSMLIAYFSGLILIGVLLMCYGWVIGGWYIRATNEHGYFSHNDDGGEVLSLFFMLVFIVLTFFWVI